MKDLSASVMIHSRSPATSYEDMTRFPCMAAASLAEASSGCTLPQSPDRWRNHIWNEFRFARCNRFNESGVATT